MILERNERFGSPPSCFPLPPPSRRVHITGATLALLAGAYAVEDAAMEHGDPYLRELGEPTYLVIDPRVRAQPGPHGLPTLTIHSQWA